MYTRCNRACLRYVVVFKHWRKQRGTRYVIEIDVIDRFYKAFFPSLVSIHWSDCGYVSGHLRVTVVRKNSSILVVNERFDIDDTLLFTFNKYTLYRGDKHSTSGTEQPIPPPTRAGQVQWHVLLSRRTFKYSRLIELERREKEFFILFISLDIAVAHGRRDKIFIQKMEDGDKVLFVIGC